MKEVEVLTVTLVNDQTEKELPEIIGNYTYEVSINGEVIAKGRLTSFNRLTGWKGLISYLGRDLFANPDAEGGECESILWEKE